MTSSFSCISSANVVLPSRHAINNNTFTKKLCASNCSKLTAALYQPTTLKRSISHIAMEDQEDALRRLGKASKSSDEEDITTVDADLDLVMSDEDEHVSTAPIAAFYRGTSYSDNVARVLQQWGDANQPCKDPVQFLQDILVSRGYETDIIESATSNIMIPLSRISIEQLHDYDMELVTAVKESNLPLLREMQARGRRMDACNKFGESLIHLACRRSSYEVIAFLVQHNPAGFIVDDCGRTPLHDACWSPEPRFDVVALLLDRYLELLRHRDNRGDTPLHFVRREHWPQWCAFLQSQQELYWAPIKYQH